MFLPATILAHMRLDTRIQNKIMWLLRNYRVNIIEFVFWKLLYYA